MGVLGAFSDWVGIRAVVTLDALEHAFRHFGNKFVAKTEEM